MMNWTRLAIASFLVVMFLGAPAWACGSENRPPPRTNNVWFCYNSSDTVVVFVHGVLSDSNSAWHNETQNSYWPSLIASDPDFENPAIFLGGYPTDIIGNEFDLDGAVNTLFQQLDGSMRVVNNQRQKAVTEFKRIVIIAHSLGGVVTRRMLMQFKERFQDKEIGLVLLGSPSRGSHFATLLEPLAIALSVKNNMLEVLEWRSGWLETFHSDFKSMISSGQMPKLIGIELFEANPVGGIEGLQEEGWFGKVSALIVNRARARTILSQPIVPKESAGEYWGAVHSIGNTDHFSLVKPLGPNDDIYVQVRNFYVNQLKTIAQAGCDPPPSFKVLIETPKVQQQPIPISIIRDADDLPGDADNDPVEAGTSNNRRAYLPDPPFPCPGEKLKAWITPAAPASGSLAKAASEQTPWFMCFKRSQQQERKDKRFAKIDCLNRIDDKCVVPSNPTQSGMAEPCEGLSGLESISYGVLIPGKTGDEQVWITPSLATILRQPPEKRISYTEFRLVLDLLPEVVDSATHYEFEIRVNDHQLYFDGWPPDKLRKRYRERGPLVIDFALDSLNFNGAYFGYEQIEARVHFFGGPALLHTAYSRRPYTAYSSYSDSFNELMKRLTFDSGGRFTWQGHFRPSQTGNDRYAIMLQSAPPLPNLRAATDKMDVSRHKLEALKLMFEGRPVVGRLYPSHRNVTAVGLSFAIRLETGRTEGGFSLPRAKAICRLLLKNHKALIKVGAMTEDAFIYEYDPAKLKVGKDSGQFFSECRRL